MNKGPRLRARLFFVGVCLGGAELPFAFDLLKQQAGQIVKNTFRRLCLVWFLNIPYETHCTQRVASAGNILIKCICEGFLSLREKIPSVRKLFELRQRFLSCPLDFFLFGKAIGHHAQSIDFNPVTLARSSGQSKLELSANIDQPCFLRCEDNFRDGFKRPSIFVTP